MDGPGTHGDPPRTQVTAEDWPFGLRCMDCDDPLEIGAPYSERLVGFTDEDPVVEIVCVPCGLRGAA